MIPVLIEVYREKPGSKIDLGEGFTVVNFLSDHFEIESAFDDDVFVVFNQVYDPSWELKIDGEPAPLDDLDGYFIDFKVPGGYHEIELSYENDLFKASIILNYLITFLLVVYLFYHYFFSKRYSFPEE